MDDEILDAARATLQNAADNDATDEEWARQARAALFILTRCRDQVTTEAGAKLGPCILERGHVQMHTDGGNNWMLAGRARTEGER